MTGTQETILYVMLSMQNQDQAITYEALQQPLNLLGCVVQNLEDEFNWLVTMGLLVSTKSSEYELTDLGETVASRIHKSKVREEFSGIVERASNSKAYIDFCGEVYGYRMPLFNMMDKEQLDFIFDSIQVSSSDTVLDVGCGTGGILNHLVEKYACNGIGIDQLDPLDSAKNGLINYIQGDLDNIAGYELTANICLAIDSLYFSENMEALICDLKSISNRMYLFYSQYLFDATKKHETSLLADHTRLGSVLLQTGCPYKTIDFSTNEQSLYEKGLTILPKYRDLFEAEGNVGLYEAKLKEYTTGKSLYDQGLASRYLYVVTL